MSNDSRVNIKLTKSHVSQLKSDKKNNRSNFKTVKQIHIVRSQGDARVLINETKQTIEK